METFSALPPLCAGNPPLTGGFPWRKASDNGALMFSLICTWTNSWVHNRDAGDLRRYRAHYEVTVMHKTSQVHETLSTLHDQHPGKCYSITNFIISHWIIRLASRQFDLFKIAYWMKIRIIVWYLDIREHGATKMWEYTQHPTMTRDSIKAGFTNWKLLSTQSSNTSKPIILHITTVAPCGIATYRC